ncbi:DUF805 domain-containing protein [Flavobacterium sufflavum]|uniref:DUF805 domain-containing protein n=1 Tax=Flavobacterium sufflavum TaxID=1921138 RepID=A0A437L3G3_9FLAO|nr:DUF805 domain-containing protein [Flavobacterium sufflavum]RVT79801.1 DUF805 domain-containing protein [Flavobacterium sufflavum]
MIEWYKKVVFENYASFSGRARRSEYWYFILANMIIGVLLTLLDNILGFKLGTSGVLSGLYNLAVFIPSLAVSVRRLHDIGKSGKLLLLFYGIIIILVIVMLVSGFSVFMSGGFSMSSLGVAFFGPLLVVIAMSIWMLILFCTEGEHSSNKYGPDPKNETSEINKIGTFEL